MIPIFIFLKQSLDLYYPNIFGVSESLFSITYKLIFGKFLLLAMG